MTLAAIGEKGFQFFKEETLDMVLIDLGIPEMSGWEVCRKIKQISPDTPAGMMIFYPFLELPKGTLPNKKRNPLRPASLR